MTNEQNQGANSPDNYQFNQDPASQFNPQNTPTGDAQNPGGDQYAYFDPAVNSAPQNQGFEPSSDFNFDTNQDGNQYQNQNFSNESTPNSYGQSASDYGAYGSDSNQSYQEQNSDLDPAAVNTFEEKKTGNKRFLIIVVTLIVLLLVVAGVLFFLNSRNTSDTVEDTSSNNSSQVVDDTSDTEDSGDTSDTEDDSVIDVSLTGGPDSIATQARKFTASSIPNEWNLRKFFVPNIDDETGECLNVSVCGPDVDPDRDGLDNLEEYNFDVDPLKNDTDNDKIADGDELYVYYTDPDNDDSDLDTFTDGQEIAGCFDPVVNGSGKKYTSNSLAVLQTNTSLYQLHEPTVALLRGAGALSSDILESGVPLESCDISTEEESSREDDSLEGDESTGVSSDESDDSTNTQIDNNNPI